MLSSPEEMDKRVCVAFLCSALELHMQTHGATDTRKAVAEKFLLQSKSKEKEAASPTAACVVRHYSGKWADMTSDEECDD